MDWKYWKPKEPVDIVILTLHVFVLINTLVFEILHLRVTEATLIIFVLFLNVAWTVSLLLFVYRKYEEVEEGVSKKIQKLQKETIKKDKEFQKRQQDFELREKTMNDSLLASAEAQERLSKKANYADVLKIVNSAFGEVHRIMRELNSNGGYEKYFAINLEGASKEELQKTAGELNIIIQKITISLTLLCNQTAAAFRILTGDEHVGVCIKGIIGKDFLREQIGSCYAKTLVRDDASRYDRGLDPVNAANEPILHYLTDKENTSFSRIIQSIKANSPQPFFCNSLPLLAYYENTSFLNPKYRGRPTKRPGGQFSDEEIIQDWTLPYRACIVFPLLPDHIADKDLDKLEGFLCVDTFKMNVFNAEYDIVLLAGLSDGVYNKVHLLNMFIEKLTKLKETLAKLN